MPMASVIIYVIVGVKLRLTSTVFECFSISKYSITAKLTAESKIFRAMAIVLAAVVFGYIGSFGLARVLVEVWPVSGYRLGDSHE